jgi:hypothetical protein
MGFQSVEEEGDRQQVGATARAEATVNERSMHRPGLLTPVGQFDTALSEKGSSRFLGVAQAVNPAAVEQIGVLDRCENCEKALYASGLRIVRREPAAEAQRGEADLDCVRKAGGCLCPRAASAE